MSMEVQAKYLGGNVDNGYRVNVRTAHPKGNIGDAGVIRTFKTEEDAKLYAQTVNDKGYDFFTQSAPVEDKPVRHEGDEFIAAKTDDEAETKECPPISRARAMFNRLTDEQIKAINETGKLPEGVKIEKDAYGNYHIGNNFINLTPGTRTVPAGYELKKDWMGFTVIVPKDTESVLIKDVA